MEATVRWKSLAGAGLVLMIIYALINIVAAIAVPATLEAKGAQGGGSGGAIFSRAAEEYMVGMPYAQLHQDNPKLDKLLVDSMLGMCSQMMALGIALLGIAWFAARGGVAWAPRAFLVCAVVPAPYYFRIAADVKALGGPDVTGSVWMMMLFAVPAVLGAVLMMAGARRGAPAPAAAS